MTTKQTTCAITGRPLQFSDTELAAYRHFELPTPEYIPDERFRRLLSFRPAHRFFRRECARTQTALWSTFSEESPITIWSSDLLKEMDPLSYGLPFDTTQEFFRQLHAVWKAVPRSGSIGPGNKDCSKIHQVHESVSCEYLFDSFFCVNSHNSSRLLKCVDCGDCHFSEKCRRCYECVCCSECENLRWSENCIRCKDSAFLLGCRDCNDCLFSTNIAGGRYVVFNQQVSETEYERIIAEWNLRLRPVLESAQSRFADLLKTQPVPHVVTDRLADNSGNYLFECAHVGCSFECRNSSQLLYCCGLDDAHGCVEGFGFGHGLRQSAQFVDAGLGAESIVNCIDCWGDVSDLQYCSHCHSSRHLLGCVGLIGKEYCILNKQYSPSEYKNISQQIIRAMQSQGSWGKFFGPIFSEYPYNLSAAGELMPLSPVQAELLQLPWSHAHETFSAKALVSENSGPDGDANRFDMPLEIISGEIPNLSKQRFVCEMSAESFSMSERELRLYDDLGVPPPTRAPSQRIRERLHRQTPLRVGIRKCSKTEVELASAFPVQWRQPVWAFEQWILKNG